MKKAKELKAENGKAELDSSRLHELAQIEEELRQKETTEGLELTTTILPTHLMFNNKDEKPLNETIKKPMTFEESKGMHQVEPSPHSGDIEESSFGLEINTTMVTTTKNSEISSPQLFTTIKTTTKLENSGDGEGSADDPFQTSTSISEDGIEKETIHETMHVQTPIIIKNITNEEQEEEKGGIKKEGKDSKEMAEQSFKMEENSDDKLKVEEKFSDSKEVKNEEMNSSFPELTESKVEGAHPINFMGLHTEKPSLISQMNFKFFSTTEEPEIMVGDKSLFEGSEDVELLEPGKALIHHMSNENGEEKKKEVVDDEEEPHIEQQQTSSKSPISFINVGNTNNNNQEENSDVGFILSKEEETDESKISTKGSIDEENINIKMSTISNKPFNNEEKMDGGIEEHDNNSTLNNFMVNSPMLFTTTEQIMNKELLDNLNMNDSSIGSTENLITSTIINSKNDEDKTEKIGNINEKEFAVQGKERNDDDFDSHLLHKFPNNDNLDITTPKRGDLPVIEETTMILVEPQDDGKPEKVEEKSFISSNETFEDHNNEENQITELQFKSSTLNPEQLEKAKQNAFHTSFSIRFPDIEWRPEFSDLSSGAAKKLIEQIMEDLRMVLSKVLGQSNTLLDVNISNLRKGSLLVEGEILTNEEIIEPQTLSSALEQAILEKGGELGRNLVDTDKLQIGGHLPNIEILSNDISSSSNGQQKREEEGNNSINTGLIIGGAVIVGVLIIVFAIFAIVVFGLNNRRNSQGSLKLSGRGIEGKGREEISMVENGNGAFGQRRFISTNDGSNSHNNREDGVNLTALRSTNGYSGSQFISPTNGTNRH
ncbi:SEA domain-containing protein [Meloidogyne graminicola]|uniref:SEA domain-containing protein n=1 Tax=Meloidogyne graminicola TaxID=189291 RepID=A0A8S9ZY98_9BILA|nr:SEA domain-containing protein [Meloidogyne graminicola]